MRLLINFVDLSASVYSDLEASTPCMRPGLRRCLASRRRVCPGLVDAFSVSGCQKCWDACKGGCWLLYESVTGNDIVPLSADSVLDETRSDCCQDRGSMIEDGSGPGPCGPGRGGRKSGCRTGPHPMGAGLRCRPSSCGSLRRLLHQGRRLKSLDSKVRRRTGSSDHRSDHPATSK